MSKNTTNLSDLPCTCGTLEQYVDGLCPGCIEAADQAWLATERALARDAAAVRAEAIDLTKECIYPQPTGNAFPQAMIDDAFEGDDESAVREGDDDRYYSGSGESMDDSSYERYLNRG
jgi:hypothetical protein